MTQAASGYRARRRLSFQLTPLLDLLLIVIFAQYMEVQQRSEAVRGELSQQQAELAAAREAYREQSGSLRRQHLEIADRWAQTLDLPQSLAREIAALGGPDDAADQQRLRSAMSRLQKQIAARGDELLQFVVQYDEMQKHVSMWELHLLANGQAELSDGVRRHAIAFASKAEFSQRMLDASKLLDEPKTLVILLLTYEDTQAGFRRIAAEAMPALTQALREDSGRTRWYDYTLLGFRPRSMAPSPTK